MPPKKSKAAKSESSTEPQFERALDLKYKVGAHVSAAKGVENSVTNAVKIGSVEQKSFHFYSN